VGLENTQFPFLATVYTDNPSIIIHFPALSLSLAVTTETVSEKLLLISHVIILYK